MTQFYSKRRLFSPGALLGLSLLVIPTVFGDDDPGAVYVMSNAASGNSILIINRAANGALSDAGNVPTGGQGTGSGLGSQGALILSADQRWLLAVNPRSNDITVSSVAGERLQWRSKTPSG